MKHFDQFRTVWAMVLVISLMVGCRKPDKLTEPKVTLLESETVVTQDEATLFAVIKDKGGCEITQCGFCYGTDNFSDTVFAQNNANDFSCTLTGLMSGQRYVCKAFARNKKGFGCSEEFVFITAVALHGIVVTTHAASDFSPTSAFVGGVVESYDGDFVGERGVCYSTDKHPSIDDAHLAIGSGVGEFGDTLRGLMPNMMYYLRAYTIGNNGAVYGQELTFMTLVEPMAVQTGSVSDIVSTRVRCEGCVIRDGDHEVTERGFCYGLEPNPTVEGLHVLAGRGMGTYHGYLSGLQRDESYHVRAYSVNEVGIAYGQDIEFVPSSPEVSWTNGILPGLFSVSDSTRVRFSQGNLQYKPYLNQWRFAECQWDFVGGDELAAPNYTVGTVYDNGVKCDNAKTGFTYNGWIDLFGWGTSGWNCGNQYYKPWNYMSSEVFDPYYGPYGNYDLMGEFAHSDWGIHNHIINGGWGQWRTLSYDEFAYLLEQRVTPSGIRFAKATLAGICGMVILPDNWDASTFPLNEPNQNMSSFANIISAVEWMNILEPAGAVFLPSAGTRYSYFSYETGYYVPYYSNTSRLSQYGIGFTDGNYWTATQGIGMNVASTLFMWDYCPMMVDTIGRSTGQSVRLVTPE